MANKHMLQDEHGNWSSARIVLIGALAAAVVFGLLDFWPSGQVNPRVWDVLQWALGAGGAGQLGPRMASYLRPQVTAPDVMGRDDTDGVEPTP